VELIRYVEDLRNRLLLAAESGGEQAREQAERLMAPLDASVRLVLLEALSAAADEITRELAPGSVDVRLRGVDPEFVVTSPDAEPPVSPVPTVPPPVEPPVGDGDEGAMARVTLRLPEPLKARVEQAATRSGQSVNAWLVDAATAALSPSAAGRLDPTRGSRTSTGGQRLTGWAR
jgi:hypothetical protein